MRSCTFALALGIVSLGSAAPTAAKELPVATGEYQILLGGKRIGEEQFRVFEDKGYRIESTRTLYWPEPSRREMRYELERGFEPKKLTLQETRAGIVTELKLDRKGDTWRAETKGQGRKKKTQELGQRSGTHVDFDSLLFNTIVLRALSLEAGESRSIDIVTLALPDLAGARGKQTYRRVEDEEIETKLSGTSLAAVYELRAGETTHRLWVGPSGAVLKGRFERVGGEEEIVLTRFTSKPGAWLN